MSKEKLIYLPVGILTTATMLSGAVLGGAGSYAAETTKPVSVTVGDACSFTEGRDYTSSLSVVSGQSVNTEQDTSKPSMTVTCNDPDGFSIFAVGASDPIYVGDTEAKVAYTNYLVATSNRDANSIPSVISADASYWTMKLTQTGNGGTIQNGYGGYSVVPNENTAVFRANGSTTGSATATLRADYEVHTVEGQESDTYTGKVKYMLVHSSSAESVD